MFYDYALYKILKHIIDITTQFFARKRMLAPRVNDFSLVIEHIVVLQLLFTDTEVVLLYFRLRPLQGFGDPGMGDDFPLFEVKAVHHFGYTVGTKQLHQVILKRNIELGFPGVTLASRSPPEL